MGGCLKPCEHRPPHSEAANDSVDWLQFVRSYTFMLITMAILGLIPATNAAIIQITVLILKLIHSKNALTPPPGREERLD